MAYTAMTYAAFKTAFNARWGAQYTDGHIRVVYDYYVANQADDSLDWYLIVFND
jgi:hypothetical protein